MKSRAKTKISVTALVVGLDEAPLLGDCIDSVSFCDEVLYLDLGSSDSSVDVARNRGASIHRVTRHSAVEAVIAENIRLTNNRWVLLIDPDERVSEGLSAALCGLSLPDLSARRYSAISVPWQFYFKSKKLAGTPWGGLNSKSIVFDTAKCKFVPDVHRGKVLAEGTGELKIDADGAIELSHYWFSSWKSAIEKHRRYANLERDKLSTSRAFSIIPGLVFEWPKRFLESYILCRGYRDLWVGLLLSILWATYQTLIRIPKRMV
jgi:hypothetical protein